jgi:hypothetical protein
MFASPEVPAQLGQIVRRQGRPTTATPSSPTTPPPATLTPPHAAHNQATCEELMFLEAEADADWPSILADKFFATSALPRVSIASMGTHCGFTPFHPG